MFGKELNISGGVVKHPKNIKEEYFKRNLTLLQKWLSILFIFIFIVIFTFICTYIYPRYVRGMYIIFIFIFGRRITVRINLAVSEERYHYHIYAYVVRVYSFAGSTESHMLGEELTLSDELRYLIFHFYLCT